MGASRHCWLNAYLQFFVVILLFQLSKLNYVNAVLQFICDYLAVPDIYLISKQSYELRVTTEYV